ncbi:helix-loop-helix DNA-binding domain-containing protein [Gymnopilus junonius]|uniref:Helix-loop-helix DNA-binding domain-containing protein n=1 Tax=Gymnopilus junonius TaxID=109634 RepID=A0A9P5ND38_GYMJU|nr:helix-loop-helix DNA-binding domain-containing protein [Gymnopilus junonius]
MSFFNQSNSPYKPQVRQEGFSPTLATNTNANPSAPDTDNHSPVPSPQGAFNDIFSMPAHTFLADNTSNGPGTGTSSSSHHQNHHNPRKYPSSSSSSDPTMDFGDELASLMGDRSPTAGPHGQGHLQRGSSQQYEERYGPGSTHNIFDISAPTSINNNNGNNLNGAHPSSVSSTTSTTGFGANGAGSTPSSLHSEYHPHHAPPGFNSTLPALNSSMRYEPHAGSPINAPPSAFHNFNVPGGAGAGLNRHTPSPIHSHSMHSPILGGNSGGMGHHHSHSHGGHVSRSRSRSRPPTGGATSSSASNSNGNNSTGNNAGGIGPARTTRARRNNSVSGTSPPPFGHHGHHGRPHAIVIPGSTRGQSGNGQGPGWFGAVSGQSSASEYSLPTPADTHPLSHSLSHSHHQYTPFSLSDGNGSNSENNGGNGGMHPSLPPVSSLHSPLHLPYHNTSSNNSNMSVPGGGGIGIPKSPLEFSLNAGIPKSPSLMDYGLSNFGGNPGSYGMTPPSSIPSMGNMGMGVGMNNMNMGMGMAQSPMLSSSMGVGVSSLSNGLGGRGVGMLASSPPGGSILSSSLPSAGLNSPSSTVTGSIPASGTGAGAGASGTNASSTTAPTGDKQSLLANEKRRRRRESHNAVERRRRDNINEKISELATLIPECMLDGSGAGSGAGSGTGGASPSALAASPGLVDPADPLLPSATPEKKDSVKEEGQDEGGVVKANKGMILRKSVEYIRYLQQLVTAQGARNRELEQELKAYRGGSSGAPSETGDSTSSNLKKDLSSPSPSADKDLNHLGNGDDHDHDMMLHDGSNMDFSMMGGYGSNAGGMLPSMPEGDDEDDHGGEGEEGMDIDGGKERREGGRVASDLARMAVQMGMGSIILHMG